MKREFLAVLAIAAIGCASWSGSWDSEIAGKLDPDLARELRLVPVSKEVVRSDSRPPKETSGYYPLAEGADRVEAGRSPVAKRSVGETVAYPVMLRLRDAGDATSLRGRGVLVGTVSGNWVTALVPVDALLAVARDPAVLYVHSAQPVYPLLDVSVPETKASELHAPLGIKGQGVLVGVVDSGFDWSHEDFKKPDGKTRVALIWDLFDSGGPSPAGFSGGTEWTQTQIDAGQCRETERFGHGTHVTGIAAGDGSAAGNGQPAFQFVGMAPEADVLFVKHTDPVSGLENEVVDGVNYILQKAASLGKPVAINLSLGNQVGPHDGTSPMDQMLDASIGSGKPGKIVCAAAGNDGDSQQPIHAGTTLVGPDSQQNYPYTAHRPGSGQQSLDVEVWYPAGQTVNLRLWVPTSQDGSQHGHTSWVGPGQQETFDIGEGPVAGVKVQIVQQSPWQGADNGLNYAKVSLWNPSAKADLPISNYFYWLEYDGPGVRVDVWQQGGNNAGYIDPPGGNDPLKIGGDNQMTVGPPASAKNVIAVGSYVTKNSWTDVNGQPQTQPDANLGQISWFSSRGPLRDGFAKPDIAAPGEVVFSARWEGREEAASNIAPDGKHVKKQGTSMSCPHVTGACALLLQANPNLDSVQMKELLQRHAIDAGDPGWDTSWGSGKLDVKGAYEEIAPVSTHTPTTTPLASTSTPTTEPTSTRTSVGFTPTATATRSNALLADADGSGRVDANDLLWLVREWHSPNPQVDFTGDLIADYRDVYTLCQEWNEGAPAATSTASPLPVSSPSATHTPTNTPSGLLTPTQTPTQPAGDWADYPADPDEPDIPAQDIRIVSARISGGEFQVRIGSHVPYPANLDEILLEVAIDADNNFDTDYLGEDYAIRQGKFFSLDEFVWKTEHALYQGTAEGWAKLKDLAPAQRTSDTLAQVSVSLADLAAFSGQLNFTVTLTAYDPDETEHEDGAPDEFPFSYAFPP